MININDYKDLTTTRIDPNTNLTQEDINKIPDLNIQGTPTRIEAGLAFEPFGGVKDIDKKLQYPDLIDIPEGRAQAQSGWDKLKGFTGQLVTEGTLGALEGIGYALDFEEVFNAEDQAKEGFDNWFSNAIRGVKENIQEGMFPVYQTHDALEGSLWDRMTDSTFWAAQGKTVGTTLSLMIPSVGVAGLAGKAGKALKIAKEGSAALNAIQGISAALFSRKAESAMEAHGTFDQEYNRFLNEINPNTGDNYTDDEARTLAGQAAAGVFKANAAMLPVDMLQYTLLLKPAAALKGASDAAKATKLGKVADYLFQIPSEAAEEAYQFVAAEEAVSKVRNQTTPFGEGFGDRLSEYVKDPEFQTSAMLGGLMGGVFGGMGPVIRGIGNKYENFATNKAIAANLKDEHSLNKIDDNVEGSLIARAVKNGKVDSLLQTAEHLREHLNNKEFETPEEKKGYLDKLNTLTENAQFVKQKDEDLKTKSVIFAENPELRKQYALDQYGIKKYGQRLKETETSINKTRSEFLDNRETAVGLNLELVSLRTVRNMLERDSSLEKSDYLKEHKKNRLIELDKRIEGKTNELNSLLNSGTLPEGFDVKKYKTEATNKLFYDVFNRDKMAEAREVLITNTNQVQNLTVEEAKQEEVKIATDIQQNIKKAKKEVVKEAVVEAATGGTVTINDITTDPVIGEEATKQATTIAKGEPVDYTQAVVQEEAAPVINTSVYEGNDFSNVTDSKELANTLLEEVSAVLDQNNPEHLAIQQALTETLPTVGNMEELNNVIGQLGTAETLDVNGEPLKDTVNQAINDFFYNKSETSNSETVVEAPVTPVISELTIPEKIAEPTDVQPVEPTQQEGYYRGNIMEYRIEKEGKTDYSQQPYKEGDFALQDKPEEADGSKTDYDPEWINNPKNFTSGALEIEAFDSPYNQGVIEKYKDNPAELARRLQLLGVHYDSNGKRHTVTMMPSQRLSGMTDTTYNSLVEAREQLAKDIIEYYKDPANKGTIYKSNMQMDGKMLGGQILRTDKAFNLTNEKGETPINPDILPDGKIYLGVVRQDADGLYVETPEFGDKSVYRNISPSAQLGDTFMWAYDAAGNLIPTRVYTAQYRKIKEQNPEIYEQDLAEVRELLSETDKTKNSENLEKLKDDFFHVYTRRTFDPNNREKVKKITFIKGFAANMVKQYRDALEKRDDGLIKAAYQEFINEGFTPSEINSLLSGQQSLRSGRAGTKDVMFVVEVGNTDPTNPNSVYSPEFERFMSDMQHQISVNQINRESKDPLDPNYNDVVGQFLNTNISPTRVTHSPVVKLRNIRRKEDVVTPVKQEEISTQADIQIEKDKIEKERKEELEKEKATIAKSVRIYDGIGTDGEATKVEVREMEDGKLQIRLLDKQGKRLGLINTYPEGVSDVNAISGVIDVSESFTKTEQTLEEARLTGKKDKINAKYDARLLELNKQEINQNSIKSTTTENPEVVEKRKSDVKPIYSNSELSKIGTIDEYVEYLGTVFPNSKNKNVFWHGSLSDNLQEFNPSLNSFGRSGVYFFPNKKNTIAYSIGRTLDNLDKLRKEQGLPPIVTNTNRAILTKKILDSSRFGKVTYLEGVDVDVNYDKDKQTYGAILNIQNIERVKSYNEIAHITPSEIEQLRNKNIDTVSNFDLLDNIEHTNPFEEVLITDIKNIHLLGSEKDINEFKNFMLNKKVSSELTPEERSGGFIPLEAFDLPEPTIQNPEGGIETSSTEREVDEGKISADKDTKDALFDEFGLDEPTKQRTVDESLADKQKWDASIEMRWLQRNINLGTEGIEVEISEDLLNIGDSNAWGTFKGRMVEIWENAPRGTLFHEAFHTVFDMVLSEKKKQELYKEAAKRYKIDIKDNLALEEAMAEEFREYIQSREYTGNTLSEKIANFFRRLYNYFRYNLLSNSAIDEFFDAINTGRYKHSKYTPTSFDAKKRFEGLTYVEQNNRILNITNSMSNVVDRLMVEEGNVNKSRVDVIKELGVQRIGEIALNDIYKYAINNKANLSRYQLEQVLTMLSGFMELRTKDGKLEKTETGEIIPKGTIGFLGKKAIKKFALTEKLRINLENKQLNGIDPLTEQEVLEASEEIDKREHWMITATEQSRKDRIGSEIKSMLSRIVKKDSKGNPVKDDIGMDSYLDFNESFATLLRELSGSTTSAELVENLDVISMNMPEYRDVYERVIADDLLKTKFWVAMQNVHSNFKILLQQNENMDRLLPVEKRRKIFKWMEANRQSITTSILDDWRQGFNNPAMSKVAEAKSKLLLPDNKTAMDNPSFNSWATRWIEGIEKNNRFSKGTNPETYYNNPQEFHKLLNALGFDITIDELSKLKESKFTDRTGAQQSSYGVLVSDVSYIYKDIIKGIDIVSGEVDSTGKNRSSSDTIKKIARSVSMVRPDMMESSHRSGENKTVYSHILMGFLPKLVHRLKKGDEVNRLLQIPGLNELPWLRDLLNESDRQALEFAIFDSVKMLGEMEGTVYNNLTPTQLNTSRLHAYFNNGDKSHAYYMVPVLGDASVSMYIKGKRLNNADAIDAAFLTLRSEWAFMKEADRVNKVKHLGDKGSKFALFSELNSNPDIVRLLQERDIAIETRNDKSRKALDTQIKSILTNYLDSKVEKSLEEFKKQEVLDSLDYRILQEAGKEEDVTDFTKFSSKEEFVKNYVYNNVVAKANIITLFVGSPAAYGNTETVYKRLKEIWSPGTRIDTKATFNLTPEQMAAEGTTDRVITVGDNYVGKIVSDIELRSAKQLGEDVLNIHLAKGKGHEAYAIAAKLGYTNYTLEDGTDVAVPLNDKGELILEEKEGKMVPTMSFKTTPNNLTDGQSIISPRRMRKILLGMGRWTNETQNEFAKFLKGERNDISLNPLKPFVFGFRDVNGLRVPYQVKNSETMADPSVSFFTKDNKVELPTIEDRNNGYQKYRSPLLAEMLDFMERYSYGDRNYQDFVHFNSTIKVGEYDVGDLSNLAAAPQHTLSNDDYMIISEVGDHFTDDVGNFGTQLRKLIIADLSDSAKFNVLGTTTKEEVVNLYHDIVDTDVRESFDRVEKHFPEVLPKDFTTEQLDAYNSKIKELSNRLINEANDRNLGSEAIYALETYKDKDGIERFNIPLFDPIQASRTEALLGSLYRNNVVKQRINGGNLVMVSSVGLSETLEIKWNADKTAVEYLEVYAPHWWAQELEGIIDPTTGIVDMNKITDKSILDIIGYRIPTEDKYSMLPLRIKAFLPRSSGGIIILPQEITTLSGADFDIDKLYVMFPNFRTVRNWDFDKLTQEVKELGYAVNKEYIKKLVLDSYKDDTVFTDRDLEIYDTINLLPDAVVDRISKPIEIRKIKYNANKTPKENSKKARDNAKMDIIRAVLTNPDVTDKLLDPGNFEYITTLSREIKRKKDYSANLDILDPTTDSKMFEAAMAAAGLIGVFANQNINHAIFQHGDVNLSEPIQFGNKIYSSLSRVYAEDVDMNNVPEELKNSAIFEPKRISRKLSMFLSAIVDDLKHLNSGPLNINFFTADVLSTMMRLGEDMNIALAFINQPSIIRLQELNQKYGDTFDGFKKAMDDVKKEYNNIDTTNDAALTLENLWDAIGKKGAQSNDFDVLQITALNKFEKLRDVSFDLGRWVRAFRSDNIKRKVNLASNEVFERNVDKALKQTTFIGADTLWNNYPMLKAFYDTAVTGASETLNRFFLYNSPLFTGIKDKISANLVGRKELAENNIANVNFEIMSALINQFDFFQGDLLMQDGKTTVREHILNNFPKELEQFMIDNPKFKAGYKILRQLKRFEKGAGIAIDTLRFRNTGTLTDVDKAEISESWKQLLYYKESDNMEFNDKVRKLGEDLVKYSFFAYGFHQTSDSFSQYIPLEWRKRLRTADGTITFNEFLESLFDMSKNDMVFQGLYEQFKQHYAANRFFVQRWEAKTTEELNKAIESGKLKLDKAGNPVELNLHINSDEVMVLEKRSTYGVGNEGRFPDYVAIDYKDRIYLFRANGVNGMGSETEFTRLQSYEVIPTLGVKRFAKEYTPNALNKKSVFDFNNVSTEPTVFKPVVETTEQATTQQAPALETTTESSTFVKPDDISQESWDKLNNEQKQRLIDCG